MRIVPLSFFIKVATKQFCRIRRKFEKLYPLAVTSFAECLRFLGHTSCYPISQGQSYDLRDTRSRLEEQTGDTFFSQSPPFEVASPFEHPAKKRRIIDNLGNPGVTLQLEVTV